MLSEMIALQREFDARHGWKPEPNSDEERITMMGRELIGLVGEVGEFANIVKKLQLLDRFPDEISKELADKCPELADELVDLLIYAVRLAALVGVDLDKAYRKKLLFNEKKYRHFER